MFRFLVLVFASLKFVLADSYADNLIFTVYKSNSEHFVSPFNESLSSRGCDVNGKLSIITHGWHEDISSVWVGHMIGNLTVIRGGCILFVDYSFYGNSSLYITFLSHFPHISAALTRKYRLLEKEGFNPNNWFMFAHSAGARLVIDSSANFGYQKVREIDVCELAGPGFDFFPTTKHPQKAAKNVACIHTSALAGTAQRLCHQDWMMGECGRHQPGSDFWQWFWCQTTRQCEASYFQSHGLCPHLYNSAFRNDFVADNSVYKCGSQREPSVTIENFKMGYMESRKSSKVSGDFFAPTAINMPWNVVSSLNYKSNDFMNIIF